MTVTVLVKRCPKCGETKRADEFSCDRTRRDGLKPQCKQCARAYYRAYDEAHREERRAYHEAHREERRAYHRAYREAHREERRARGRDRKALIGSPSNDRWQEITVKHATRKSDPWSEAEDAYLAASTDRIVDDALALKRTFESVSSRITHLRARGVPLARDQQEAAA